jgi:hypothetical protein
VSAAQSSVALRPAIRARSEGGNNKVLVGDSKGSQIDRESLPELASVIEAVAPRKGCIRISTHWGEAAHENAKTPDNFLVTVGD